MKLQYKKLGQYIELVTSRNSELKYGEKDVRGVSNSKELIETKANNKGRDFSKFFIVLPDDFIYNSRTSRMGDKVGLSLNNSNDTFVTSFNNTVFRVVSDRLLPAYLFMWFKRPEFDRYARYHSWGSSTELFSWDDMCNVHLPVPSVERQRAIVHEYNVLSNRIALNDQLTQKLEDTAQAIYKQWFIDFEFPISKEYAESIGKPELEGMPYKSSSGEMEFCEKLQKEIPSIWSFGNISDLGDVTGGATPSTSKEEFWGGSISWLSPKDISKNGCKFVNETEKSITELGYKKSSTVILPAKSVLFTSRAPVGLIAINTIELCTNQGFKSVVPKKHFFLEYVYFYLKNNTEYIEGQGSGTTFVEVSATVMKRCNALIPDELTLKSFSSIAEKLFSRQLENESKNKVLNELVKLLHSKLAGGL